MCWFREGLHQQGRGELYLEQSSLQPSNDSGKITTRYQGKPAKHIMFSWQNLGS
jgi:hypothetical protein